MIIGLRVFAKNEENIKQQLRRDYLRLNSRMGQVEWRKYTAHHYINTDHQTQSKANMITAAMIVLTGTPPLSRLSHPLRLAL